MNIQEYILSGVLEAYLLGGLTEFERAGVEKNLLQYPELREELALVEGISERLFVELAIEPPAVVKEKLMKSIQPYSKVVEMRSRQLVTWRYVAAASIAVALVASFLAQDYRSKWRDSEFALHDLTTQNKQIVEDYNRVNLRLDKVENDLHVVDNPAFTKVLMKGTPNAPNALASVYWNEQTKEVFLSLQNLRALSQNNQYQLWAIIDGKPVDAGVFDGDHAGLIKMKAIAKGAVTFAVTIEPRGGKSMPSLETMQVAGKVTKG